MTRGNQSVIVFGKCPLPGLVKTRLGKQVGHDAAATLYVDCAEHIIVQAASGISSQCSLCYAPSHQHRQMLSWIWSFGLEGKVTAVPQVASKDLGDRMLDALGLSLTSGYSKAVLLGTDIPDITAAIIEHAFAALDHFEIVLGPAIDGGFYLIGASRIAPDLFKGVQWSSPSTREATVHRAQELGFSVAPDLTLPALQDLDGLPDIQAWTKKTERDNPQHPLLAGCRRILDAQST